MRPAAKGSNVPRRLPGMALRITICPAERLPRQALVDGGGGEQVFRMRPVALICRSGAAPIGYPCRHFFRSKA
jgi:hypothetical protein